MIGHRYMLNRQKRRSLWIDIVYYMRSVYFISIIGTVLVIMVLIETKKNMNLYRTPLKRHNGLNISSFNRYINYDNFSLKNPHFVSDDDEYIFKQYQFDLFYPSTSMLRGVIEVQDNATIHPTFGCGWQVNISNYRRHVSSRHIPYLNRIVCPLLVPQSNTFQHFIDGVLPKIMQSYNILKENDISIMIYRPWDKIILSILNKLNLEKKVIFYDTGYFKVKYLLNTCDTPPIHPTIWTEMRTRLTFGMPHNKQYVVLLSREDSRNYGRNIKNINDIQEYLEHEYPSDFRRFRKSMSYSDTVELFSNARIILGAHGGAFYNIIFAESSTHIVEFMPIDDEREVTPKTLAYNIVWKMSSILQQNYWRIMTHATNQYGDMYINITKLKDLMNKIA